MKNKYLLDTHTFLWAVSRPDSFRLGDNAKEAIEDIESELFVSAVCLYEITNKYRIGKLPEYHAIIENYIEALAGLEAKELALTWKQAHLAGCMDWDHRDPFDRMLAAQAVSESMTLITRDKVFAEIPGLSILW